MGELGCPSLSHCQHFPYNNLSKQLKTTNFTVYTFFLKVCETVQRKKDSLEDILFVCVFVIIIIISPYIFMFTLCMFSFVYTVLFLSIYIYSH